MIKIKDLDKVFWIDREEAVSHLTNGYIEIFGEEFRDFFESIQDKMIDEGIKAGRKGYRENCLNDVSLFKFKQESGKEEDVKANKESFLKFFNEDDYNNVMDEEYRDRFREYQIYKYYKNLGIYDKMFVEKLNIRTCDGTCKDECYCNGYPPKLYKKNPPSFKYFKKLKHSFMGSNMYGENGMSLDRWTGSNVDYYIEEGEWFYFPESIARTYYFLGSQIGKCQLKEEFVNQIIETIDPTTTYEVVNVLSKVLNAYSTDYDQYVLYPMIRKFYFEIFNEELKGLDTDIEVRERIDNFLTEEKTEELINLFKEKRNEYAIYKRRNNRNDDGSSLDYC